MIGSGASTAFLRGLKVLVVEDETIVSFLVEQVLSDLGCTSVWVAANVENAKRILQMHAPDLAVLDVNLAGELVFPIVSSLEVADIPFVFTTGYGREGLLQPWPGHPVVHKPYDADALLAGLAAAWTARRGLNRPAGNAQ
ncbi:MAG TPA: response regulator [Ferrovibrio sp.]|uniref:response regulator n=1 Tax=Ferrovibrio sp. TaxID=1917215 RepID=UPI002ECFB1CA